MGQHERCSLGVSVWPANVGAQPNWKEVKSSCCASLQLGNQKFLYYEVAEQDEIPGMGQVQATASNNLKVMTLMSLVNMIVLGPCKAGALSAGITCAYTSAERLQHQDTPMKGMKNVER
eukprot:1375311-Amphidinium_carterae.1